MIDNFAQIRNLLSFPTSNSFYFLEIIKRRKENPDMLSHAKLIRDYYLNSFEKFDEKEAEIKELCDIHKARAYFRLNVREADKIAFQYNKRLAELLITKDFHNIARAYPAVVGEFHHDTEKKWLIDLDYPEDAKTELIKVERFNQQVNEVSQTIKDLSGKILLKVSTKNGAHLITSPFRRDVFKIKHPEVEINPDANTILYMA